MASQRLISSTDTLARDFNKLSRNPKVPSGMVPNDWHFDIRYLPLEPNPGHIVALINPGSMFSHLERLPLGVGDDDSAIAFFPESSKAAAPEIAKALLHAFISGMGMAEQMGRNAPPAYGPWNFTTTDPELADAVGAELKRIGVRSPRQCKVGLSTRDTINRMNETFGRIYKGLAQRVGYKGVADDVLVTPDFIDYSKYILAPHRTGFRPRDADADNDRQAVLDYVVLINNTRPLAGLEYDTSKVGPACIEAAENLEKLIQEKPEDVVRRDADEGNPDAALDYGVRLKVGLRCTPSRTRSREYLCKAILAPGASDTVKATAHAILIQWCLDSTPTSLIGSRYMLMASHHADQAAFFARRVSPKGADAPPAVLIFHSTFNRMANQMPQLYLFYKHLLTAFDGSRKKSKEDRQKMQQKRLERPLRYKCAAVGCRIQADKGKMLQQCSGKCDADKKPSYCSKECQKADWKNHKPYCVAGAECSVIDDGGFNMAVPPSKSGTITVPFRNPVNGSTSTMSTSTLGPEFLKEFLKLTTEGGAL